MDEVDILIKQLKDPDPNVRSEAAEALGYLRNAKAVPHLISIVRDENAWPRSSAAVALGHIGDVRAVPPLIEALKDKDSILKCTAVKALVTIAGKADIDLVKVRDSLKECIDEFKDSAVRKEHRIWGLWTYLEIANAVSERKRGQMGGALSEGTVPKPSGKKGIYRIRRAVNG